MQGSWAGQVAWRWDHSSGALGFLKTVGLETLAAMLFGMWAYRSGLHHRQMDRSRYRRIAIVCLAVSCDAPTCFGAE